MMAYDRGLFERLEIISEHFPCLVQKKMFGGICWFYEGNICFGILNDFLILRVGVDLSEKLLQSKFVKPMDITGKIMKGWVMVLPEGYESDEMLFEKITLAVHFVKTLPPK